MTRCEGRRQVGRPVGVWLPLWVARVSLAAIARQLPSCIGEAYQCLCAQAKRAVLRSGVTGGDNIYAHTLSSLCSGFVASLVSTPAGKCRAQAS